MGIVRARDDSCNNAVFGLQSRIQQLPTRYGAPAAVAWDRGHQCPLRVRRHQNGQSGQEAVDHDRRSGGGAPLGLPRDTPDTAQPSQRRRRRRLVRTLAPDRTCLVVLTVSGRVDGPEAGLPAFSAFLSRRGPGGSFQVVMGVHTRMRPASEVTRDPWNATFKTELSKANSDYETVYENRPRHHCSVGGHLHGLVVLVYGRMSNAAISRKFRTSSRPSTKTG